MAKVMAHNAVVMYREAYGLWACNGILFNHESPRRGETFVTRKITRGLTRIACGLQDTLTLGDVSTFRDWGYAPEYVDAMWRMMQAVDVPMDFALGTGRSYPVSEFLNLAMQFCQIEDDSCVETEDARHERPLDVAHLQADSQLAQEALEWEPRVGLTELCRMMVESDMRLAQQERDNRENAKSSIH